MDLCSAGRWAVELVLRMPRAGGVCQTACSSAGQAQSQHQAGPGLTQEPFAYSLFASTKLSSCFRTAFKGAGSVPVQVLLYVKD